MVQGKRSENSLNKQIHPSRKAFNLYSRRNWKNASQEVCNLHTYRSNHLEHIFGIFGVFAGEELGACQTVLRICLNPGRYNYFVSGMLYCI